MEHAVLLFQCAEYIFQVFVIDSLIYLRITPCKSKDLPLAIDRRYSRRIFFCRLCQIFPCGGKCLVNLRCRCREQTNLCEIRYVFDQKYLGTLLTADKNLCIINLCLQIAIDRQLFCRDLLQIQCIFLQIYSINIVVRCISSFHRIIRTEQPGLFLFGQISIPLGQRDLFVFFLIRNRDLNGLCVLRNIHTVYALCIVNRISLLTCCQLLRSHDFLQRIIFTGRISYDQSSFGCFAFCLCFRFRLCLCFCL